MKTKVLFVCIISLPVAAALAEPPPAVRARHADRNRDGVVTHREIKADKEWARHQKAKVDTPWEARADKDHDGVVEPKEAARMNAAHYMRTCSAVDRPWEVQADTNKDGKVSRAELHAYHLAKLDADHNGVITVEERRAHWKLKHAVVDTPAEKRYDTNGDGYLSWDEGREFLKDRLTLIKTNGRAAVSNEMELEFDTNKDGVIDRDEAVGLKAALDAL